MKHTALAGVAAAATDLLGEQHARIYVAELPSRYHVDLLYEEGKQGCEQTAEEYLANPLGRLDDR